MTGWADADHGRCDRCEGGGVVGYADEVCVQCDHVPLCLGCLREHEREAAEDGTAWKSDSDPSTQQDRP